MSNYHTVIAAVDLSNETDAVLQRASALAQQQGATLHVAHVLEPLSLAYGGDMPMDFAGVQEQLQQQATEQLDKICTTHNIPQNCRHLLIGQAEQQIHQLSSDLNADLIVLGSHGRKGLALLLGSTANGVLHGANCDVLAVRVGKKPAE